jgi:predicted XRE-type DNA-binding protein
LYQFSNLLRLKNIKTGKIKKPILMKNGYYIYSLWEHNKEHKKYIHDLVLEILLKQNKLPKQQCRHLDGNKLNNSPLNLKLGSSQEDADDRIKHGKIKRGSKQWKSKLNETQVRIIKHLLKDGKLYQREVAKIFNVNLKTISDIKMNKTWKHVII